MRIKEETMDTNERTEDIFEHIDGYQKPALIPIPEYGDLSTITELGVKSGRFSEAVVQASMAIMGFKSFQQQLPHTLENLLRRSNLRGAGLFAPIISATTTLDDDPRELNAYERAATLLFGARSLYDDLRSARLPQDMYKERVLEMGQYPNLFSTSLIVENKSARIYKSKNVSQVTVLAGGRMYLLQVGKLGTDTSLEQLSSALKNLHTNSVQNPLKEGEYSPGILTCASHASQLPMFTRLQEDDSNRNSLLALRDSFVTLCLDLESEPSSSAEAAKLAQSTNGDNRWHHSSFQLVVFGNAKACTICNFNAYVDGNAMARGSVEVHRRALLAPLSKDSQDEPSGLPPVEELTWRIPPEFVERAREEFKSVTDDQKATFEIGHIGRGKFTELNIPAVPAFILALQLTARHLTGEMAKISQFLSLSAYRCMDLTFADVTTPEVSRFVEYMDGDEVDRSQAMSLMQEAINSQSQAARDARRQLSFSKMLGLFMYSKKGFPRMLTALFLGLTITLLKLLGMYRSPETEILVSHPTIYPEVEVIGRPGIRLPYVKYFSLHYQIMADKIVITPMPGVTWEVSNQVLVDELEVNLEQILWVAAEDN